MKIFIFSLNVLLVLSFSRANRNTLRNWWRYTEIYEIYVWSFKDSNGDGTGDINGIRSMLDHFVDLNVETLWLSPYCKSPMADMGYDISDFKDIDPKFGTLDDFDRLIHDMKKKGLKLVMDLVVNHCSDQHPWFNKSVHRIEPYTDYFVWKDPKGYDKQGKPIPPNNWPSAFWGSAWEWNTIRKQFYLHQFSVHQVDFDLRNAKVVKEIKNIMKFWLNRGVSGFRLDAPNFYFEDDQFRDEGIVRDVKDIKDIRWEDYDHKYTKDQPETYSFISDLRSYIDIHYNTGNDYEKRLNGYPTYVIVFNLGTESEILDLHLSIFDIPSTLYVVTSSTNTAFSPGDIVENLVREEPENVIMRPTSCLVLSSQKYSGDININFMPES